ncbi:MAG: glutamate synthase-related protein [Thaumarchaeota archaeon]|nr:glutamate synthase-related protein [Nitrososphaerota archaeon]
MSTVNNLSRGRTIEVTSYLPIPPSRSREFWSKWKIQHIRQLATTGEATGEPLIPDSERTQRVLDKLHLKFKVGSHATGPIRTSVPLFGGSPVSLATPLYLGDMSFGALSGTPNIAIARAADITEILAGTGEGGLLKEVADCSRITVQWASARFGVTISSLTKGQAVVIKIGQGAKPGIGGHLPGIKVTEPISETRRIPIGKDAISPAPHHDIYSIEDLGQRILGLKEATRKPIFVKVGATNYIPYIASGIARMGAAGIIIDGAGAGTGAAPSVVKNNVGIPIELATASVDTILRKEGLREGFTVIAAGRVSTPEDSLKLMALGADVTSLGTATLMALGCLMVHKCHIGYCPAVLTNKISPNQARSLSLQQSIKWMVNLINGWNAEMKLLLERMGVSDIREIRGRRDLLHHDALNDETAMILGFETFASHPRRDVHGYSRLPEGQYLWPPTRVGILREMAGTTGKFPAESEISSMGTNSPPFIDEPVRLSDWLVSDGAQVTRPSIDPYREEIEISTYIGGTGLRLSSPFFFTHLPKAVPASVVSMFAKVATGMGLLLDIDDTYTDALRPYCERMISDIESGPESGVCAVRLEWYLGDPDTRSRVAGLAKRGARVLLRSPTSWSAIASIVKLVKAEDGFSGIILDEDETSSDMQIEAAVSLLDRELKEHGVRGRLNIVAESNGVRGSDDIFKIVALGADCVGMGKAALLAIGVEEGDREIILDSRANQRLENFVSATQKDIKLLAGAAGISNINSTLTGNRELLRSIDLDPSSRIELGVKPAGAA